MMKNKTITIREDQDEYIRENHLNLSSLVREIIDERMDEEEDTDE